MGYSFISGATGGLGRAFVFECARNGENLFITGRSEEKLKILKEEVLSDYPNIDVVYFPCRLDKEDEREKMFFYLTFLNLTFSRLINVAGADIQKSFTEYTQKKLTFQIRSNFEAAVSLTKYVLEHADEGLKIIAISSVSGIYPMPYFAIYSAEKGATTSFFISLREELKDKQIHVTTVLPGAIPTREDVKRQIKGQGLWGRIAAKSPEFVARKSLAAVEKNKRALIPGFWNKFMNFGTKIVPLSLKLKFIAKRWSKISKDAF